MKNFATYINQTEQTLYEATDPVHLTSPTKSGVSHYAMLNKGPSLFPRKDGHQTVGMAGYVPKQYKKDQYLSPNSEGTHILKSGMITKHKDSGKYTVGNVRKDSTWHDSIEDAVAHAHKRLGYDKHVEPHHVLTKHD